MSNQVVLVNENDEEIGVYDKIKAHEEGLLHRAFSVFIFNDEKKMYIQKRSSKKYHSGGLWTNTCCSHPNTFESIEKSAQTRLYEEMGMYVNKLHYFDKILYYVDFENGLKEHEIDYIFWGISNDIPKINPEEVEDWRIVSIPELIQEINENPQNFTFWFKLLLPKIEKLKMN